MIFVVRDKSVHIYETYSLVHFLVNISHRFCGGGMECHYVHFVLPHTHYPIPNTSKLHNLGISVSQSQQSLIISAPQCLRASKLHNFGASVSQSLKASQSRHLSVSEAHTWRFNAKSQHYCRIITDLTQVLVWYHHPWPCLPKISRPIYWHSCCCLRIFG